MTHLIHSQGRFFNSGWEREQVHFATADELPMNLPSFFCPATTSLSFLCHVHFSPSPSLSPQDTAGTRATRRGGGVELEQLQTKAPVFGIGSNPFDRR
jgi:hypothetical protein